MSQIRCGHFEADGNAYNLVLGFVPDYIKIINANAADTEVQALEWFSEFGDDMEIWHYIMNNDGGNDITTPVKKGSGGYVAEYDTNSISSANPVTVSGGKGVTISASFMSDSDEIYYIAIQGDRDVDHGDIA